MELLYQGFDGLDISFQGRINHRLCVALENAKLAEQRYHRDEFLEWCDIGMLVKECGARGGYAFTVRTEAPQAVWFFKKPNTRDPWGIRISCDSYQLAIHGLDSTREQLINALKVWGIQLPALGESIGRVDYAMDFPAPSLVLEPSNFVMHSNSRRADHHSNPQMKVMGSSGRVTSVTIGQMPGRQVIVYDKRDEVIAKRKSGWLTIWNATREREGKPRLDLSDPRTSRVWRVEIRSGKKHLKDTWNLRTWADLDTRIGDVLKHSIGAVRYAKPTADNNRARWPNHLLWEKANEAIACDLFEMRNFADQRAVKNVELAAYDQMLQAQLRGLYISRAALHGIEVDNLNEFVLDAADEVTREFLSRPTDAATRLERAKNRYRVLS